jgi:hypothetical protein
MNKNIFLPKGFFLEKIKQNAFLKTLEMNVDRMLVSSHEINYIQDMLYVEYLSTCTMHIFFFFFFFLIFSNIWRLNWAY